MHSHLSHSYTSVHKVLVLLLLTLTLHGADADFYLDSNNVTIKCSNALVGDAGTVGGVTYTKIESKDDLIILGGSVDATQACTSGVTDMNQWFNQKDTFDKNISHWDTSSVMDMSHMFYPCHQPSTKI